MGKPEGRDHWGDLGVDGWISGWICRSSYVGIWTGLGWPRIETADGCVCGNETWGSVKCGNFLTNYKQVRFSRRTLHHGVSK